MKAFYLAGAFTFAAAFSAHATTDGLSNPALDGLSAISADAQADLVTCLSNESSSRAIRACTKSLRAATPDEGVRAHLYTRRALHRMALGRFDDASEDFGRAGDLQGHEGLSQMGEGFAALMEQDLATARARFEDCQGAEGLAPLAAYGLGLTHQMAGDAESARTAYQSALTLRPGWTAVAEQMATLENR
ncbi:MAG: hypothetical protein WBF53_09785 [Litorimonas sp.]